MSVLNDIKRQLNKTGLGISANVAVGFIPDTDDCLSLSEVTEFLFRLDETILGAGVQCSFMSEDESSAYDGVFFIDRLSTRDELPCWRGLLRLPGEEVPKFMDAFEKVLADMGYTCCVSDSPGEIRSSQLAMQEELRQVLRKQAFEFVFLSSLRTEGILFQ